MQWVQAHIRIREYKYPPVPKTHLRIMPKVWGQTVDSQTRCVHYHSPLDVIAIRFKCCDKYFPCYQCHTCENVQRWDQSELDSGIPVILCGVCNSELTFQQYSQGGAACSVCQAKFNPRCLLHYHLYFNLAAAGIEQV